MALKLAQVLSRRGRAVVSRQMSSSGHAPVFTQDKAVVGTREIVGFGINGSPGYYDMDECPMPSVRFREEDSAIKVIREKEKGDWKKLTMEEKKALYRFSFCQTFAEFQAPRGHWKIAFGWGLIFLSTAYGLGILFSKLMPRNPAYDIYYDKETRIAAEQRRLDMGVFRTRGFATEWDLEKRDWKK